MKTFITSILFCVVLSGFLPAQDTKLSEQDPFLGNYVVGNNAEIQIFFKRPYSTIPINTGIQLAGRSYDWEKETFIITEEIPYHLNDQFDIAAGDFDGDRHDDIAIAGTWWSGKAGLTIDRHFSEIVGILTGPYSVLPERSSTLHVAAGDFDWDPQQEIVMAYLNSGNGKISIGLYEIDSTDNKINVLDEIDDLDLVVEQREMDFYNRWIRFDITTGDYDGDGLDEVAIVKYKFLHSYDKGKSAEIGFHAKMYDIIDNKLYTTSGTDTIRVRMFRPEMQGIKHPVSDGLVIESTDLDNDNMDEVIIGFNIYRWADKYLYDILVTPIILFWYPGEGGNFLHYDIDIKQMDFRIVRTSLNVLNLVCSDLNMDGKDEIIVSDGGVRITIIEPEPDLKFKYLVNNKEIFDNPMDQSFYGSTYLTVADLDADTSDVAADSVKWLPEIVVVRPDLKKIRIFQPVLNDINQVTGLTLIDEPSCPQELSEQNISNFAIAPADRDGDALRFGRPRQWDERIVVQPHVYLNAPPVHFDIINGDTIDLSNLYTGNSAWESRYTTEITETAQIGITSKHNWSLSNKLETGGFFNPVKVSLKITYGEKFSKEAKDVTKQSEYRNISTAKDDIIIISETDYSLWEYPIYYKGTLQGHVLVSAPYPDERPLKFARSRSKDVQSLLQNHEVGNLLSYQYYNTPLTMNPELSKAISSSPLASYPIDMQTQPGSNFEPDWYIIYQNISSDNCSAETNFAIDASVKVDFWDVLSWETEGKYGKDKIVTHEVTIDSSFKLLTIHDKIDRLDADYYITPYAYWSRNGAIVLDYSVELEGSWWQEQYGKKPDPAFNLPWRYDSEKYPEATGQAEDPCKTKEIIIWPEYPEVGDTLMIATRVHNYSLKPTDGTVTVYFYLEDPDDGGIRIIGTNGADSVRTKDPIEARNYGIVTMEWVLPSGIASNYINIYAVIDPRNLIDEIHENNNKGFTGHYIMIPTSVENHDAEKQPEQYVLYQNYPNPFNPSTKIKFKLPGSEKVKIEVFNTLGRKVTTLLDHWMPAGNHEIDFIASDFTSGVYFYRIQAGSFQKVKKMLILK